MHCFIGFVGVQMYKWVRLLKHQMSLEKLDDRWFVKGSAPLSLWSKGLAACLITIVPPLHHATG